MENEILPPLPSPHETEPPPSPPHQTETLPSPSHQTVSPPQSLPPNTNLSLIPFLAYNPKPMTTVFPSKTPSSPDPKPCQLSLPPKLLHLRFLNPQVLSQRNQNLQLIRHLFPLEGLKGCGL